MDNTLPNYEVFQESYLLDTKTGHKIFAPVNITIVLKNQEKHSCVLHEIKEEGIVILFAGNKEFKRINSKDIISITEESYF